MGNSRYPCTIRGSLPTEKPDQAQQKAERVPPASLLQRLHRHAGVVELAFKWPAPIEDRDNDAMPALVQAFCQGNQLALRSPIVEGPRQNDETDHRRPFLSIERVIKGRPRQTPDPTLAGCDQARIGPQSLAPGARTLAAPGRCP